MSVLGGRLAYLLADIGEPDDESPEVAALVMAAAASRLWCFRPLKCPVSRSCDVVKIPQSLHLQIGPSQITDQMLQVEHGYQLCVQELPAVLEAPQFQ